MGEGEDSIAIEDHSKQPLPGVTTVILPAATRNQELTVAQQKRIRDKEYQRKKRASVSVKGGGDSDDDMSVSGSSRRAMKRARVADDE